jgi:hypothetical protein
MRKFAIGLVAVAVLLGAGLVSTQAKAAPPIPELNQQSLIEEAAWRPRIVRRRPIVRRGPVARTLRGVGNAARSVGRTARRLGRISRKRKGPACCNSCRTGPADSIGAHGMSAHWAC